MKRFFTLLLLVLSFSGCGNVIVEPIINEVSFDSTTPAEVSTASLEEKQTFLNTLRSLDDVGELHEGIFSLNEKAVLLGVFFNDIFNFSAATEWVDIETADVRLKIPFSPEWNIAGTPLAAFDLGITPSFYDEKDVGVIPFVVFGRFVSGLTYAVREYYLKILPKNTVIVGPVMTLEEYAVDQCPLFEGVKPPTAITVGRYSGVTYLYGGSKGCATVFASIVGDQVFFLYRRPLGAAGTDGEHEISEEMERIIESIRLK